MEHKIVYCPHCGKTISKDILDDNYIKPKVTCPECGSQRNYKDGKRKTLKGKIQLYICVGCGYRFSERPSNGLKISPIITFKPKR
jgi:DNA-directed RNA polymerase subunit RPC12/RpoP